MVDTLGDGDIKLAITDINKKLIVYSGVKMEWT